MTKMPRSPRAQLPVPRRLCRAASSTAPGGSAGAKAAERIDVRVVQGSAPSPAVPLIAGAAVLAAACTGYYVWNTRPELLGYESLEQAAARERAEEAAAELRAQEEARKAAEEIRQAAEEKAAREREQAEQAAAAAAAAERQRELSAIAEALLPQVSRPGVPLEVVAELRALLSSADAEGQGFASSESFAPARMRFGELQQIAAARDVHEVATGKLEEAVAAEDTERTRSALEELRGAAQTLSDFGEELPPQERVVLGRQQLEGFELRDRKAAAPLELQDAVASRNPQRCKAALQEAGAMGLAPSPLTELAAVIAEGPLRLMQELATGGAEHVIEQRCADRAAGLSVDDFVAAAAAVDNVQVEQAVELVRALVRHRESQARGLQRELANLEPKFREVCAERQGEAMSRFRDNLAGTLAADRAALQEEWERRTQDEVVTVRRAILADAQAECERMRQEVGHVAEVRFVQENAGFSRRIAGVSDSLQELDTVVGAGKGSQQRSEASSTLASALMLFVGALVEGKPSGLALAALKVAGDDFVTSTLRRLPSATVEMSHGALPTEPEMRRRFKEQLNTLVAAAFAPPVGSSISEYLAVPVGWLFGSFYKLRMEEKFPTDFVGTPTEGLLRTLNTLASASLQVDRGQLAAALEILEAELPAGPCRASAESWMKETRHTLLLQQAARAAQARARCLGLAL